jgi:transposase
LLMILELHRQGMSVSAISRKLELDRKTVRKYVARGLAAPTYGPRAPRLTKVEPYLPFLADRLKAFPGLSAERLLREIRELGYSGGYTCVREAVRELRPSPPPQFEHRFETEPGEQAQVDFAQFQTVFEDDPGYGVRVWLFSLVLGHSRWLWGRFVMHQDLITVLRCHVAAFLEMGGVPRQILYDQMKTAVLGESEGGIVYNSKLLGLAHHYGFTPRSCAAYRAKTKGKVERAYRYIRQDFFLGRAFRNFEDLNLQFSQWRHEVANRRRHGTTHRPVALAFASEQSSLQPLPQLPFRSAMVLERRIARDGVVPVLGNDYSIPDGTRHRVVEVHGLLDEVQIFEEGRLIAVHAWLEGRGGRRVDPAHRVWPPPGKRSRRQAGEPTELTAPGQRVARRPLSVYAQVGAALAAGAGR